MEGSKLSLDESFQEFFSLPHSTPKTKRDNSRKKEYICPKCQKKYVSNFYFEKHVLSHDKEISSNPTVVNDAVELDVNDLSFSKLIDNNNNTNKPQFKVPAAPKQVAKGKVTKKPNFVCTFCLKGYICSRSLKAHCRAHSLQDAAARFPDKEKVLSGIEEMTSGALTATAQAPSCGELGQAFKQFIGYIISISTSEAWKDFCLSLCEELLDTMLNQKMLLPSVLVKLLFDKVECLLSSTELCSTLLEKLNIPTELHQCQSLFFLEFTLNFAWEMVSYISKTFRSAYKGVLPQKQTPIITEAGKQVIFYIGGSIMRGYLRAAYRYPSSAAFKEIVCVINEKILSDKPSGDQEVHQDSLWTINRDRGGLLYINAECQKFFLALAPVVYSCEKKDGSIDYCDVLEIVSKTDVCDLWDRLIFDSLSHDKSVNLLNDVVTHFCQTCVQGFAKRRLNFLRKNRPIVSMPTRHVVASRKTK